MKDTIAIFTSNRSEWGILEPLAVELDKVCNLEVIACASHLSTAYNTFIDIVANFNIHRVENTLDSDSPEGTCKSSGILFINLPDLIRTIDPKFVLILGDRYESLAAATVCYTMGVKIAHLHGGERSGNIDDGFRDCISRLAHMHFAATVKAENALIERGYSNVYYVGALGCKDLPKAKNNREIITVMYHPVTDNDEDFEEVLLTIEDLITDPVFNPMASKICFVAPNVDFNGQKIKDKIAEFDIGGGIKTEIITHLPRKEFLELLSNSKCLVGNSSAGIIEAPSIGIPTINIGSRQNNREMAMSIYCSRCNRDLILRELREVLLFFGGGSWSNVDFYRPYTYNDTEKLIIKQLLNEEE